MDVVYIVGTGSKWANNELRYSLRSIDKFGIGLGRVFIVGNCPSFINKGIVTHIPIADIGKNRSQSVFYKIQKAINDSRLPEEFLVSSDDHFFVKPTDFANYPLHYKDEHIKLNDCKTIYENVIAETGRAMMRHGLGDIYFEGHTNKLYSKEAWRELDRLGVWSELLHSKCGMSTNSPMSAMYLKMHPDKEVVKRRDIKIGTFSSLEELLQTIGDSNSFSIGDNAIQCGIGEYLQYLFPLKCRFEK